jgi:hypothetical protein
MKPTDINLDCMEQASTDQIVDTQVKVTLQQQIQLYWVVKVGQLLHQVKWLTQGQIQQKFPHLMGGGLIQMDIGSHPHIPTSSSCPPFVQYIFLYYFIIVSYTLLGLSEAS